MGPAKETFAVLDVSAAAEYLERHEVVDELKRLDGSVAVLYTLIHRPKCNVHVDPWTVLQTISVTSVKAYEFDPVRGAWLLAVFCMWSPPCPLVGCRRAGAARDRRCGRPVACRARLPKGPVYAGSRHCRPTPSPATCKNPRGATHRALGQATAQWGDRQPTGSTGRRAPPRGVRWVWAASVRDARQEQRPRTKRYAARRERKE
jgi:hypothetical protein